MSTDALALPVDDRIDPRVWKICAVVLVGRLMAQRDSTVVMPILRINQPGAVARP